MLSVVCVYDLLCIDFVVFDCDFDMYLMLSLYVCLFLCCVCFVFALSYCVLCNMCVLL